MINKLLPSISVIVPTYNRKMYLIEAIDSILAQAYHPIEIIVIDDGSTDDTKKVMGKYNKYKNINYIYQENAGQAAARNHGIYISTGEYLAFLDSDDLWTLGKLHDQIIYLESHPELKMLFGYAEEFYAEKHKALYAHTKKKVMPGLVFGTMMIRKKDFLEIGYLQEYLHVGEFIEWFNRAKEAEYLYEVHNDIVLKRRLHDNNIGLQKYTGPNNFAQILRASLYRRRKKHIEEKGITDE